MLVRLLNFADKKNIKLQAAEEKQSLGRYARSEGGTLAVVFFQKGGAMCYSNPSSQFTETFKMRDNSLNS